MLSLREAGFPPSSGQPVPSNPLDPNQVASGGGQQPGPGTGAGGQQPPYYPGQPQVPQQAPTYYGQGGLTLQGGVSQTGAPVYGGAGDANYASSSVTGTIRQPITYGDQANTLAAVAQGRADQANAMGLTLQGAANQSASDQWEHWGSVAQGTGGFGTAPQIYQGGHDYSAYINEPGVNKALVPDNMEAAYGGQPGYHLGVLPSAPSGGSNFGAGSEYNSQGYIYEPGFTPGSTGALSGKPLFAPYNNGDYSTQVSGTIMGGMTGSPPAVALPGVNSGYGPGAGTPAANGIRNGGWIEDDNINSIQFIPDPNNPGKGTFVPNTATGGTAYGTGMTYAPGYVPELGTAANMKNYYDGVLAANRPGANSATIDTITIPRSQLPGANLSVSGKTLAPQPAPPPKAKASAPVKAGVPVAAAPRPVAAPVAQPVAVARPAPSQTQVAQVVQAPVYTGIVYNQKPVYGGAGDANYAGGGYANL